MTKKKSNMNLYSSLTYRGKAKNNQKARKKASSLRAKSTSAKLGAKKTSLKAKAKAANRREKSREKADDRARARRGGRIDRNGRSAEPDKSGVCRVAHHDRVIEIYGIRCDRIGEFHRRAVLGDTAGKIGGRSVIARAEVIRVERQGYSAEALARQRDRIVVNLARVRREADDSGADLTVLHGKGAVIA